MIYESEDDCLRRHHDYPDLALDLVHHDFQRRRVASSAQFVHDDDMVLDVGCNTGYFKEYCPQAREVHGVDINPSLVQMAAARLDAVWVAKAEALPFDDGSYDVVNVSAVLEQCYDPLKVLQEAARVSRRNVVGNTCHASGTWGKQRVERHAWQARSFTELEIRTLLEQIGLIEHLGTVDVNTPPEPQVWYFEVRPYAD